MKLFETVSFILFAFVIEFRILMWVYNLLNLHQRSQRTPHEKILTNFEFQLFKMPKQYSSKFILRSVKRSKAG